jgi:hypothetical protein
MVMNRTQQDADFVFASTSRHQKPFTGVGMKNRAQTVECLQRPLHFRISADE